MPRPSGGDNWTPSTTGGSWCASGSTSGCASSSASGARQLLLSCPFLAPFWSSSSVTSRSSWGDGWRLDWMSKTCEAHQQEIVRHLALKVCSWTSSICISKISCYRLSQPRYSSTSSIWVSYMHFFALTDASAAYTRESDRHMAFWEAFCTFFFSCRDRTLDKQTKQQYRWSKYHTFGAKSIGSLWHIAIQNFPPILWENLITAFGTGFLCSFIDIERAREDERCHRRCGWDTSDNNRCWT